MSDRFVLLRHECPNDVPKPSHWDLMLESGVVLLTWELRELPEAWCQVLDLDTTGSTSSVPAIRLADHRLDYLDYEGPISDGRGRVHRLDRGKLTWFEQSPTQFLAELQGDTLQQSISLSKQSDSWQLKVL